jgi:putative endonuclease
MWWSKLAGRLRGWMAAPLGTRGERQAARYLRRLGYRILARNLRTRLGEVDLLAGTPDGVTIVVVEVKAGSRAAPDSPRPEVHVNRAKQRKLIALAAQLRRQPHLRDRPFRFDVIGVDQPARGPAVIRHHIGAFQAQR